MIAYAIVILTDMEDIREACFIEVRYGTTTHSFCGEMVREFIKCTNHAYTDYPFGDCLAYGLTLIPPKLRPIFEHLYETLKEVFIWNE